MVQYHWVHTTFGLGKMLGKSSRCCLRVSPGYPRNKWLFFLIKPLISSTCGNKVVVILQLRVLAMWNFLVFRRILYLFVFVGVLSRFHQSETLLLLDCSEFYAVDWTNRDISYIITLSFMYLYAMVQFTFGIWNFPSASGSFLVVDRRKARSPYWCKILLYHSRSQTTKGLKFRSCKFGCGPLSCSGHGFWGTRPACHAWPSIRHAA